MVNNKSTIINAWNINTEITNTMNVSVRQQQAILKLSFWGQSAACFCTATNSVVNAWYPLKFPLKSLPVR